MILDELCQHKCRQYKFVCQYKLCQHKCRQYKFVCQYKLYQFKFRQYNFGCQYKFRHKFIFWMNSYREIPHNGSRSCSVHWGEQSNNRISPRYEPMILCSFHNNLRGFRNDKYLF